MTVQALALAALIVTAAVALTEDVARLPAAIAGASLALGLLSVLPIGTRALGVEPFYGWIAREVIGRNGVEAHRPFQFAATSLVLLASAAIRAPGWMAVGLPSVWARLEQDIARDGAAKAITVWLILSLLGAGLLVLVLAFAVLVIHEALWPPRAPHHAREGANRSLLWNVLAAGVLASAELPGLFGAHEPPDDWRFWVSLALAIALAHRVLVLSFLFAYDRLGLPMDHALAARALPSRLPARLTALALGLVGAVHLVVEREVGVAISAAGVVLASGPLSLLLERVAGGGPPDVPGPTMRS